MALPLAHFSGNSLAPPLCDVIPEAWEAGAEITFPFRRNEGPTLTGTVLEVDEPRLLAYTWGEEALRFELTPEPGGGTRPVFTDELDRGIAARNAAGRQLCLTLLAGETPAADAWKRHFDRYIAAFPPSVGPQEGPPAGTQPG